MNPSNTNDNRVIDTSDLDPGPTPPLIQTSSVPPPHATRDQILSYDDLEIDFSQFGGRSSQPPRQFSLGSTRPRGNIREFLVPHPTVPGRFILFLSNSSMDNIFKCEVMAQYHLVEHRRPVESKIALRFGGAMHKGWARHFGLQSVDADTGHPTIDTPSQIAYDSMHDLELPESEFRTPERAAELMDLYAHHYATEEFEVIAVEEPFLRSIGVIPCNFRHERYGDIGEVEVIWTGIKDLVVRDYATARRWVVDHKTTTRNESSTWDEYKISPQMQGYVWEERERHGGDPDSCAGVIIDMLVVRKKTKTGVAQDFIRQRFTYDEEQLREWKWIVMSKVRDFLYKFSINEFVHNRSACIGRYGRCRYFEVCTLPQKERPVLLESGAYEDVTWTALDEDTTRQPNVAKLGNVTPAGSTYVPKEVNPFDVEM